MIGLMDCNNFFVSCQRLFRPDLEGRPVAVLSNNDGCIVARSQEVKDLGIPMGAPLFQVRDLCTKEGVTLFSGNPALYRDISRRVMDVLRQEVGRCEVYSIDEAFFCLNESVTLEELHILRSVIAKKVGIPVTIGAAPTKTLTKQAAAFGKRGDGAYILDKERWRTQAHTVSCGEIWGIGKQTAAKLDKQGIRYASDFMQLARATVVQQYDISTLRLYDELHGVSVKPVVEHDSTERKSITSTRSFAGTVTRLSVLESAVAKQVTHCTKQLRQRGLLAGIVTVYLQTDRFGDFFMRGGKAQVVLTQATADTTPILVPVLKKLREIYVPNIPYKKTGITCAALTPKTCRMTSLFADTSESHTSNIDTTLDDIHNRFGDKALCYAVALDSTAKAKAQLRSPCYTTQWKDIPSVRAL